MTVELSTPAIYPGLGSRLCFLIFRLRRVHAFGHATPPPWRIFEDSGDGAKIPRTPGTSVVRHHTIADLPFVRNKDYQY